MWLLRIITLIQENRLINEKFRILLLKYCGYSFGNNTVVRAKCYFNGKNIKIGKNCFINNFCR